MDGCFPDGRWFALAPIRQERGDISCESDTLRIMQASRNVSFGITLLSVVCASWNHPARACSCSSPGILIRPTSADADVPTNTKIWLNASPTFCSALKVTVNGEEVGTSTFLTTQLAHTLTEVSALELATELRVGDAVEVTCIESRSESFVVGVEADYEPPPVPQVQLGERRISNNPSCGNEEFVPFTTSPPALVLAMDIGGRTTFTQTDQNEGGTLLAGFLESDPQATQASGELGSVICGSSTWNFAEDGAAEDVRWGTFDLAGNFSGWTEPITVPAALPRAIELETPMNSGCRMPAASKHTGNGWLLLLAGWMLGWRRLNDRAGAGRHLPSFDRFQAADDGPHHAADLRELRKPSSSPLRPRSGCPRSTARRGALFR